jgi:hypothetical protein
MRAILAVPLFALALQATPAPGPAAAPAPATLADVAFMAGHWLGGEEGDVSEEVWTAPEGDSMLGLWRYVSKGQARVFELLSLKAEPDGVLLRLRHFDPRLVAREEKETPLVLRLIRHAPGEAAFEGAAVGGTGQVRLTYRRDGEAGLVSVLEKAGRRDEFRFRRAPR